MTDFFEKYGIPEYGAEELGTQEYCVGGGLADDRLGDDSQLSYMLIIRDTSAAEFEDYLEALASAGFPRTFFRRASSGTYAEFLCGSGVLYLSFIPSEETARIVIDRASAPLDAFAGGSRGENRPDTCLMQYGLYYSQMKKGTSCDCGMMYAVRLRSSELIIIDGGEAEQATLAAVADFYGRIRELAGPGKIKIALWFCTHAHDDHMDFFIKFLRLYKDEIELERVMFNFPWSGYIRTAPYVSRMKARISELFPGARFLKPHSGQVFNISNAETEVLETHEDILGSHGDGYYHGLNETSTVVKMSFDGVSVLFLADIQEENGDVLIRRYPPEELRFTFVQAAHHCINRIENVYSNVKADRILIPECREQINTRFDGPYDVIKRYNDEKNIIIAGDGTKMFFIDNGAITEKTTPVIEGNYDNSGV